MKQGSLPPRADLPRPRKAWNVRRIQVICGVVAIVLFAAWYWRYGGPWKLEAQSAPKPLPVTSQNAFDQQIAIPKIPGGASSMRPLAEDAAIADGTGNTGDQVGVASRWTAIKNSDDPGQLLVDVPSIHLWRKVERSAWFQYIPKPHTMDENRNKPILYELISDSFKCAEGTAVKLRLNAYYEDGTMQPYFPWGNAGLSGIWIPVRPDTALSREMKFVCAVQLTSDSTTSAKLDEDRIFGTWHVEDGAQGRIAAGPIVISETQIAWTAPDSHKCVSDYRLASRSTGSTFPGGPTAGNKPDDAYTTFALELKGPHLDSCSQKMSSFTVSFISTQRDFAHFTAFFLAPQGYGTVRRASSKAFP